MDDDPSYLETSIFRLCMGEDMGANDPIKLGNNVITVYDAYKGKRVTFEVPAEIRRSPFKNKVAMSKGVVYFNGYRLNQNTGEWEWSLKGWILKVIL